MNTAVIHPRAWKMHSANFHEKAHFVKADVAALSWSSATAVPFALCFHPHCQ